MVRRASTEEPTESSGGATSFIRAPGEGLWRSGGGTERDNIAVVEVTTELLLPDDWRKQVLDAALIAAAQAVEHYEITRYGTLIAWAQKMLGRDDCASVLQQNLDEEKATDEKLNTMALRSVNRKAA